MNSWSSKDPPKHASLLQGGWAGQRRATPASEGTINHPIFITFTCFNSKSNEQLAQNGSPKGCFPASGRMGEAGQSNPSQRGDDKPSHLYYFYLF